jgi:hypothetical protein
MRDHQAWNGITTGRAGSATYSSATQRIENGHVGGRRFADRGQTRQASIADGNVTF